MARILHHPPPRDVGCTIFEGANLVEEERVWRRHQRENPHSFVDTRRLFISVFVCFSVFCVLCFLCFFLNLLCVLSPARRDEKRGGEGRPSQTVPFPVRNANDWQATRRTAHLFVDYREPFVAPPMKSARARGVHVRALNVATLQF
uniref:Transmembrane protein n=1 Tax=Physcomitrium patens TaxID=3218 RepID=A0A2K1K201_PHYPA|nr:hypothetical protein PHYPA_012284 [Physcomitrium patens]